MGADLSAQFPKLADPLALLTSQTGITHYYGSLRAESLKFVRRHAQNVSKAFEILADESAPTADKVRKGFRAT